MRDDGVGEVQGGEPRHRQPRASVATALKAALAALPEEPLPDGCMAPMLATQGATPIRADDYGYEVKWDGYRVLARWDGRRLQLCSRNGKDLTARFPEIAPLAKQLRRPTLLDGEIVAMTRGGAASFSALQTRMATVRGIRSAGAWQEGRHAIRYMIFDVLHHAGRSTRGLACAQRREILASFALAGPAWQVPPVRDDGARLLDEVRKAGGEGIIAKRLLSRYVPGHRTRDWIKIKLGRSDEFVVVGYWSSGKHGLSSLLLAAYRTAADARHGRRLRFCGKVGTGFSEEARRQIELVLAAQRVERPACEGELPRGAGIRWCRPLLVAQIGFSEWTHDGHLRHPVFLGLRADKPPGDVVAHPERPTS